MLIRSTCLLLWSLYRGGQSGVGIENRNSETRPPSPSHHPSYQYNHINRYPDDFSCHSGLATLLSDTNPIDFAQDSSPLTFSRALLYLLSCYLPSHLFLLLYRINLISMQTSSRITILKTVFIAPVLPSRNQLTYFSILSYGVVSSKCPILDIFPFF